jgi:hypothetical protein
VAVSAAGPHLHALLRSFTGLVPAATRLSIVEAMAEERSALNAEYESVREGDVEAAATVVVDHSRLTADNAIRELRRRGVVDGYPTEDERAAHLDLVRRIDERADDLRHGRVRAVWNGPTMVGLPQLSRR